MLTRGSGNAAGLPDIAEAVPPEQPSQTSPLAVAPRPEPTAAARLVGCWVRVYYDDVEGGEVGKVISYDPAARAHEVRFVSPAGVFRPAGPTFVAELGDGEYAELPETLVEQLEAQNDLGVPAGYFDPGRVPEGLVEQCRLHGDRPRQSLAAVVAGPAELVPPLSLAVSSSSRRAERPLPANPAPAAVRSPAPNTQLLRGMSSELRLAGLFRRPIIKARRGRHSPRSGRRSSPGSSRCG